MFGNASAKRLLQYRKSNGSLESPIENAWSEKAVRSLVKKLKSSNQLNQLENILNSKNPHTNCVCIPRYVT